MWAMTSGSCSSPAITCAGSPGNRCCSEKIRIDTKNSVGISCRIRLPRKFSMSKLFSRAQRVVQRRGAPRIRDKRTWPASSSLELQPDHTHQPVRYLLVTFELGSVGDQELAVIEIDDRVVVEH